MVYRGSRSSIPEVRKIQPLPIKDATAKVESLSARLPDQIGYSSRHESNALVDAHEVRFHMLSSRRLHRLTYSQLSNNVGPDQIKSANSLDSLRSDGTVKIFNLIERLPSWSVVEELKEVYFAEANWYYVLLAPYFFNKSLQFWREVRSDSTSFDPGQLDRDLQCFPALLFQVLATALQFLPLRTTTAKALGIENYERSDQMSQEYSSIGMQIVDILGRHNPTITAVEHDMMRAAWLKNESRGKEAWYSLGNAIR